MISIKYLIISSTSNLSEDSVDCKGWNKLRSALSFRRDSERFVRFKSLGGIALFIFIIVAVIFI